MDDPLINCPRCGVQLTRITVADIALDACAECRGIWFDPGELRPFLGTVIENRSDIPHEHTGTSESLVAAKQIENHGWACPWCDGALEPFNYGYDSNIFVERCPDCEGMWAEREAVMRAASFLKGSVRTDALHDAVSAFALAKNEFDASVLHFNEIAAGLGGGGFGAGIAELNSPRAKSKSLARQKRRQERRRRRNCSSDILPPPAAYSPHLSGVYRVTGGLSPLTRSFGNEELDALVFQIDADFPRYHANTVRARSESLRTYYANEGWARDTESVVIPYIVRQLTDEHPQNFRLRPKTHHVELECALTGETLHFDENFRLRASGDAGYVDAFDALASQVQEDLSVMHLAEGGGRLIAANITAPSGWDPREKIGKDFAEIHAPVPGIGQVVHSAPEVLQSILHGRSRQRFVWGISTDDDLDHHPERALGPPTPFDPDDPSLFVRMERQVLVGIESVPAILFCVHVYHRDCAAMDSDERSALRAGLLSMSTASREYKGVAASFDAIVDWLGSF